MIDLHCHSSFSHDAATPPEELLARAEQLGLTHFSITDHNSAKAHLALANPALRAPFSGKMIAGAELAGGFHKVNVEFLAYGFDAPTLQKKIEETYPTNEQKFEIYRHAMIRACREAGARMDDRRVEEFLKLPVPSRRVLLDILKEFPENRRLMLFEQSWEDYTFFLRQETNNPKSPLFVDLSAAQVAPETAAKIIRESGGMLFLAHPLIYSAEVTDRLEDLIDLVQPDGLECFYPKFSAAQTDGLLSICQRRGLFACGGSDFHGGDRPNQLGQLGEAQDRAEAYISAWIDRVPTY